MWSRILLTGLLGASLAGCAAPAAAPADSGELKVIASTSLIADIVSRVGGTNISIRTIVPAGADTHSFQPTPQDVAALTDADIVFVNGLGYETFLGDLVSNAGGSATVVELSAEITPLAGGDHAHSDEEGHSDGESHSDEEGHSNEEGHSSGDPHVWTDPNNVMIWVEVIAGTLSAQDAAHAADYRAAADAYLAELRELDSWIAVQFAAVPEERRLLVTDHEVFGYMAERYGLTQLGTIIPGISSAAAPSAQDLAALQQLIAEHSIRVIFVGDVASQQIAEQIAADTGVELVTVLTESLSGEAATYLDYMRSNVSAMATALQR